MLGGSPRPAQICKSRPTSQNSLTRQPRRERAPIRIFRSSACRQSEDIRDQCVSVQRKVRKRLTFEAVVVVFGVLPTAASRGRSGERGRRPETCTSQITPPMETG